MGAAFADLAPRIRAGLRQHFFCFGSPQSAKYICRNRDGQLRSVHLDFRQRRHTRECHDCDSSRPCRAEYPHLLRKSGSAVRHQYCSSGEFHSGNAPVLPSCVSQFWRLVIGTESVGGSCPVPMDNASGAILIRGRPISTPKNRGICAAAYSITKSIDVVRKYAERHRSPAF